VAVRVAVTSDKHGLVKVTSKSSVWTTGVPTTPELKEVFSVKDVAVTVTV